MSNVKSKKVLSLLLSLISIFNVSASASVTEQVTSVENQELNENVLKESKPENVEDIIRREDGSIQVLSGYNTLSDEEKVLYVTYLTCDDKNFNEEKSENGLYIHTAWFKDNNMYNFIKKHSVPINDDKESYRLLDDDKRFKIVDAMKSDFPSLTGILDIQEYIPTTRPDYKDYVMIVSVSVFSKDELLKKSEELNKKVDNILKNMNETLKENATDLEKAKFIHDYICKNCKYFKYPKEESEAVKEKVYTAYGCLCEGKAVCEGIAKAYQLLMNRIGIDCRRIHGMAKDNENGYHSWNIVKIGNTWKHTDVTWDLNITCDSEQKDKISYDYFNISNREIQKDHCIGTPYENENDEIKTKNGYRNFKLPPGIEQIEIPKKETNNNKSNPPIKKRPINKKKKIVSKKKVIKKKSVSKNKRITNKPKTNPKKKVRRRKK